MYWLKPLFFSVPFLAAAFAASVEEVTADVTMITELISDYTAEIEAFTLPGGAQKAFGLQTRASTLIHETMPALITTIQQTHTADIRTNSTAAVAKALEKLASQTKACLTAIAEKKGVFELLGGRIIIVPILFKLQHGAANIQGAISSQLDLASPEDMARSEALGADIQKAFNDTILEYSR